MTAQGNVGALPFGEEPPDVLFPPTGDMSGGRVDDPEQKAGTETDDSRLDAETCGAGTGNPRLWERFLHNLMRTLGAWTI